MCLIFIYESCWVCATYIKSLQLFLLFHDFRELLTSDTEFQIDLDFKQKKSLDPNLNDELFQLYDEEEESRLQYKLY